MLCRVLSNGASAQVSTMVNEGQWKFQLPLPCCILWLSPLLLVISLQNKNSFCILFSIKPSSVVRLCGGFKS